MASFVNRTVKSEIAFYQILELLGEPSGFKARILPATTLPATSCDSLNLKAL